MPSLFSESEPRKFIGLLWTGSGLVLLDSTERTGLDSTGDSSTGGTQIASPDGLLRTLLGRVIGSFGGVSYSSSEYLVLVHIGDSSDW